MTIYDRIVDNALYDQLADKEDFELLDIHTTQTPSGTCADLGRSANDLFYVRAHTSHADKGERQRAYLYQGHEKAQAAEHFKAIRDADRKRQLRIESLTVQLEAEHKRFINPSAVGADLGEQSSFPTRVRRCDDVTLRQVRKKSFVTTN